MAGSHFLPDAEGSTKRPDVVSVLGILTFINSGLFILIYLVGLLGMSTIAAMPQDEFVQLMYDGAGKYLEAEQMDMMDSLARILHGSGVMLMLIYLVRTVVRSMGALGIWRGRKVGFYIYAAAQLIGLFLPHLILPWSFLGFFGPLMTVAMTAAYGSQLKRMS
ncbi:MAG: hypothetical protein KDC00_06850 [Flavobacteriales bacterium]|nr:hypothetical protein [Flavobacteriales bacterium]